MDRNLSDFGNLHIPQVPQSNYPAQAVRYARLAQEDTVEKAKEGSRINWIVCWSKDSLSNYIILESTWRCHCWQFAEIDFHLHLRP